VQRWAYVTTEEGLNLEYNTALLGLIGGHFDDWQATRDVTATPDGISDNPEAPVSTGVGYVIPAEFIREALMREELVRMREDAERAEEQERKREADDNAATMDSIGNESEFERFESLTKQIINTPKPKPDEGEA
jgi:hypothetical protein